MARIARVAAATDADLAGQRSVSRLSGLVHLSTYPQLSTMRDSPRLARLRAGSRPRYRDSSNSVKPAVTKGRSFHGARHVAPALAHRD